MPRQDLQRGLPVQLGVGGLIDLAHAPLADEGGNVVMAESVADGQGHDVLGSSLLGDVLLLVVLRGQGGADDLAVVTMHDVPVGIRRM